MLNVYARALYLNRAEYFLESMSTVYGVEPDAFALGAMVEMMVRARRLGKAVAYFKRYVREIDRRPFAALGEGVESGEREDALSEVDSMLRVARGEKGRNEEEGEEEREGTVKRAEESLATRNEERGLLKALPPHASPREIAAESARTQARRGASAVFACMARGFASAERPEDAFRLMRVMQDRGMRISEGDFRAIRSRCHELGVAIPDELYPPIVHALRIKQKHHRNMPGSKRGRKMLALMNRTVKTTIN